MEKQRSYNDVTLDLLCETFKKKLQSSYNEPISKETVVYKKSKTLLVVKNRKED